MAEVSRYGVMEASMKATGRITKQTESEDLLMQMVTSTKVNGLMIRRKATASMCMLKVGSTKESG